jgi:hypothetical protein
MTPPHGYTSPGAIVRTVFATMTVAFGVLGFWLGEAELYVAAGVFGVLWTAWDVVWSRVVAPLGEWAARILTEGGFDGPPPNTRPTLDDTIRLLESHLEHGASRKVEIQAAIRLEEIYRTIRKEPDRARRVVERILEKYPRAPELGQLRSADRGRGGSADGTEGLG